MCNYLRAIVVFSAFLIPTMHPAALAASEQELLEFVRDAHRASRESIRTLSCRVEFKANIAWKGPPEKQSCSGSYWISPDAVRAKVVDFGKEHDYLWKDSVRQAVVRPVSGGQQEARATRQAFASRHLERCDPYICGLLVLNLPGTIDFLPFEQLLLQATKVDKTERSTIDGKELIFVRLTFAPKKPDKAAWNVEIQFDPEINYLVRRTKYVGSYPKSKMWREAEVVRLKECGPGVFFPEKIQERSGPDGKNWKVTMDTLIADIRVNERLPDSVFHFRYPNGVYVADSTRKVSYQVDSEGNRISAEKKIGGTIPPPPAADLDQSKPMRETEKEPQPWTRWILPTSLFLVVCGCLGLLLRHWRRMVHAT